MTNAPLSILDSSWPAFDEGLAIGTLLRRIANEVPDRTALVFKDSDAQSLDVRWTFRELLTHSEAVARLLRERFDSGDRVVIWSHNCPEWLAVQFGAALAGLILVAASPVATPRELCYIVANSRARGLVFGRWSKAGDRGEIAEGTLADVPTLEALFPIEDILSLASSATVVDLPPIDAEAAAMIQYSSGTTGSPKGALLRHSSLVNTTRASEHVLGLADGSVWLNNVPMYNTAGAALCSLNSLWNRGTHVMLRQFEPGLVIRSIAAEGANFAPLVPTMALAVLNHPERHAHDLSSLKVVVTGGSPVPPELISRIENELGADCVQVFGMTEVSSILCMNRRGDTLEHRTRTIGHPLGGIEVKIVSPDTGEILPRGEQGEIMARGRSIMMGYFGMPKETAAAVEDGWLHTGDLGCMRHDDYLQITGRLKEMIIRGGSNIYPREIEDALAEHPAVELCAVFGLPDSVYGESVAAAVRLMDGCSPHIAELQDFLKDRLSAYKVPSRIFFLDEMPMSAMNKIQKHELQRQFGAETLKH